MPRPRTRRDGWSGRRMMHARVAAGLTQERLAQLLKCAVKTVSKHESARSRGPVRSIRTRWLHVVGMAEGEA